jgi:GNAT superfamily N-acetyltransferase
MQIRVATGADAAEIARVHVASWQVAYRGLMPDSILDNLDVKQRTVRWREILAESRGITFIADADSSIIGFSNLIPSRDPGADSKTVGEIAAIYVHPDHLRTGIGRSLLQHTVSETTRRSLSAITLWVLQTNSSAIGFYRAMGFVADGALKTDMLKGFPLHEARFRRDL